MSVPVIAFFNNTGAVGKTSLVYRLSWMFADLGWHVLAVDLDPRCDLTSACMDEERIAELFNAHVSPASTIYRCLKPLINGTGHVATPEVTELSASLALLPGDPGLSAFEDEL
jgi:chromosome partitioning protein